MIRIWGLPITDEEALQLATKLRALNGAAGGDAAALAEKVELALGSDDVWLLAAAEEAALLFRALDGWLEDVGKQRLGDILYELRAEAELRMPSPPAVA